MDLEKIGKFIKERRQELGLTQKQLADTFGITAKAVSKWECGQNAPDISLLNDLSAVLNVTINEILNGCKDSDTEKQPIIDKIATKKLRIKTIAEIILVFFVLVASSLAIYFGRYYSKYYNKCSIYKVKTQSTEININGYIVAVEDKLLLALNNIKYIGDEKIKATDYDIALKLNNEVVLSGRSKSKTQQTLKEIIEQQNFFLSEEIDLSSLHVGPISKMTMSLDIKYLDVNNKQKSKNVILRIEHYYSTK